MSYIDDYFSEEIRCHDLLDSLQLLHHKIAPDKQNETKFKILEEVWRISEKKFIKEMERLKDNSTHIYLNCFGMPEFPDLMRFHNLTHLHLNTNRIKTLPEFSKNLIEFTCVGCFIEELPSLPATLLSLNCRGNMLRRLPILPENMEILECDGNNITELPEFNKKLRKVHCGFNKLKNLPKFNDELVLMDCKHNEITILPKFNIKLEEIKCDSNQISHFPNIHTTLKYISWINNPIQYLPKITEKLHDLDIYISRTPIGKKIGNFLIGEKHLNILNGFIDKCDVKERENMCHICNINKSIDEYGFQDINICYDCKDTLIDKSEFCDGCDSPCETKLTNCEMCQQNFCVNCMYLFCFECKEYYSCFWCGSKFKNENGIENVDNKSFRCSKHPIELPKFKVLYRRHTNFEAEKEQNKYVDIKLLDKAIATNTGDLMIHQVVENVSTNNNTEYIEELELDDTKYLKYIPEYKTEIENVVDLGNGREHYIMKSFVKQNGDWTLLNEIPVEDTKIDIDFIEE